MKTFLALSFYLTTIIFVSSRSSAETASVSRMITTSRQSQSPKALLLRPHIKKEDKIEKIIYFKHLMELKCLKKIFNEIRYKNRFRYLKSYKMAKPLEILADGDLKNPIPYFYKMRPNVLSVEAGNNRNFENNLIIFWPSPERISERQKNKLSQLNTTEIMPNQMSTKIKEINFKNLNEKKQNLKYFEAPPLVMSRRKSAQPFMRENPVIVDVDENLPKAVTSGSYIQMHQKLKDAKLTPNVYQIKNYDFEQRTKPLQNRPYDVKETIKEKLIIDLINKKDSKDFKNCQTVGKTSLGSSVLKKEQIIKFDSIRPYVNDKNINNSINTVLQSLIRSMDSATEKSKEIFQNSPSDNSYSPKFYSSDDNSYSDFIKVTTESKFALPTVNRQEQSKQLKIASPYLYDMFKNLREKSPTTTEENEADYQTGKDGNFNFTSIVKADNLKSFFIPDTKETTSTPPGILITDKTTSLSNPIENTHQRTGLPEIRFSFESSESVKDLEEQDVVTENQKSNTHTSFPLTTTQNTLTNFIVLKKTFSKNESLSSNVSNTFSEIYTVSEYPETTTEQTTKKFLRANFTRADFSNETIEITKQETGLTEEDDGKARTYFPEEGLILPIFTEFTDYPLTFDLLTTVKKNHDVADVWKSSKKMHVDEGTLKTTTSNLLSELEDSHQRRSDILIDENLDDYMLDDGFSTINFLKQMKQNTSLYSLLNSTSDSIIQYIPVVSNDLREGKISAEDVSTLSKVFGKYWTTVLYLTNYTNLDMLPLLKMKNEKDLKDILHTFLPENSDSLATDIAETNRDNYVIYDYEDEYKILNENEREIEFGKKEEGEENFRSKRDEKDSKYFASIKQEQNLVNHFKYYERSRHEDGFMFELPASNMNENT